MANNIVLIKRTSVPGRRPNIIDPANTQYILPGQLALNFADKKLFSTNGSILIEVGQSLSNLDVSDTASLNKISANGSFGQNGYVLTSNGTSIYWSDNPGYTGSVGIQGATGYVGSQGVQGTIGPQGFQGFQGVQGELGPQGYQGVQGTIGLTGYVGSQGVQGVQGDTGSQGNQGVQGVIGAQGFQGVQGDTGSQGNQGVQGVIGAQGNQGVQGVIGAQGFQGVQGELGPQGYQGVQGVQGELGPQGYQGVQGVIGIQGHQGVQGIVGSQGSQGVQGDLGPQGYQGIQGVIGVQGHQGVQGELGPQGHQGVQGVVGAQGFQGVQGVAGPVAGSTTQLVYNDGGVANGTGYIVYDKASGTLTSTANIAANFVTTTLDTSVGRNLYVQGNLYVNGSTTSISGNNLSITDNMIYFNQGILATITNITGNGSVITFTAVNNFSPGWDVFVAGVDPSAYNGTYLNILSANSSQFSVSGSTSSTYNSGGTARGKTDVNPDLGFAAGYNDGTYHHTGFFRDATDGVWKVFDGYLPEPDDSIYIDTSNTSFRIADFQSNTLFTRAISANGSLGQPGYALVSNGSSVYWSDNPGYTGSTGAQGFQGATGYVGSHGAQGVQGVIGAQGFQGVQGDIGPQGFQGVLGSQGLQGVQGAIGFTGSQGIQGAQGDDGLGYSPLVGGQNWATDNSLIGTNVYWYVPEPPGYGAFAVGNYILLSDQTSGSTYYYYGRITLIQFAGGFGWALHADILGAGGTPIGGSSSSWNTILTGQQGVQGVQGATGPQGVQGVTGAQGVIGAQGVQGDIGPQGNQGVQGVQGFTGYTGSALMGAINYSQNTAPQVTISTTPATNTALAITTLTTSGSPVQIIASGDANPLIAGGWGRLQLYRGGTPIGGIVHYESSGPNENIPYALQFVDTPGTGTFNYSLRLLDQTSNTQFGESTGPVITAVELQNVRGYSGSVGYTGSVGNQGTQGVLGAQGFQGHQGVIGAQGFQGHQGVIGAQGFQGVQGVQGVSGNQGVQGVIGIQGHQGVQGASATTVTATDDTFTASLYPVMVGSAGSAESPKVTTTKLYFDASTGTMSATNFNSLSDVNMKTNIEPLIAVTDILNTINPVSFDWIDTGLKGYGVIAQEIEKLLPELVHTNPDGKKTVSYDQIIPFLLSVVKDQQKELTAIRLLLNNLVSDNK